MYEKFGELDSCEEINGLAGNLFDEGDYDSIKDLAEENGIPEDYVAMYLAGDIPSLCDPLTAALGKIDVEAGELKPQGILEDWVEYIRGQCMEDGCMAVLARQRGKSLKGCMAALLSWSFGHQQPVDKDILKAAGVTANRVTLGIPGMAQAKKIIRGYYREAGK